MAIPESTGTTPHPGEIPPALYARRMAQVDGCPACVSNYALPVRIEHYADWFTAHYVCESCGHAWPTNWSDAIFDVEWML